MLSFGTFSVLKYSEFPMKDMVVGHMCSHCNCSIRFIRRELKLFRAKLVNATRQFYVFF